MFFFKQYFYGCGCRCFVLRFFLYVYVFFMSYIFYIISLVWIKEIRKLKVRMYLLWKCYFGYVFIIEKDYVC